MWSKQCKVSTLIFDRVVTARCRVPEPRQSRAGPTSRAEDDQRIVLKARHQPCKARPCTITQGTAWHRTVPHGTVRYRTALHGSARHHTRHHSTHHTAPKPTARHGTPRHGTVRDRLAPRTARHSAAWHGTSQVDLARLGSVSRDAARNPITIASTRAPARPHPHPKSTRSHTSALCLVASRHARTPLQSTAQPRIAPHRTAGHRTAPHRAAPRRSAPHGLPWRASSYAPVGFVPFFYCVKHTLSPSRFEGSF